MKQYEEIRSSLKEAITAFNQAIEDSEFWNLDEPFRLCLSVHASKELQAAVDASAAMLSFLYGVTPVGPCFIIDQLPDFEFENSASFRGDFQWKSMNGVHARDLVFAEKGLAWGIKAKLSIPLREIRAGALAPYWCQVLFTVLAPKRPAFVTTPYPLLATTEAWREGRR